MDHKKTCEDLLAYIENYLDNPDPAEAYEMLLTIRKVLLGKKVLDLSDDS